MRAWLVRAGAALRAFARGFTGLATPPPRERDALHAHHAHRASTRTPCC